MARIRDDAHQAWRAVRRRPLVSLTTVGTLTAGITLAMLAYTIVDGVLLRPLPFPRSHELLSVYGEFRPESGYTFARFALSAPELNDYQAQSRTVDAAAWQPAGLSLTSADGTAIPVRSVRVSSDLFRILEVPPMLGRVLTPADDKPGAQCAAVVSRGLWLEHFGGAHDAVGRRVSLSGESCEIVGVMSDDFSFPSAATRLWASLPIETDRNTRGNHGLVALGRLKAGATVQTAQSELRSLMAAWAQEYPHHRGHGVVIRPLKDDIVGAVSDQLNVLAWAVGFVVLVIAGNVSVLMLAHGEARRPEFAVRSALGASPASIVRQLLIEGLIASVAAAAGATLLAWLLLDPVLQASPVNLPRAGEIRLRPLSVVLGTVCAVGIGIFVSLLPALRLTSTGIAKGPGIAHRGRSSALGTRSQALLVVSELALAVALTTAAVLLGRSFLQLQRVPLGFDSDRVMTVTIGVPQGAERVDHEPQQFFRAFVERVSQLPGVEAAGAISELPLVDTPPPDDFTIEGRRVPSPSEPGSNAHYVMVTPGAFEALGIELSSGRGIQHSDVPQSQGIAVINEAAAKAYWPEENPIGRRIRYATGVADGQWSGWGPWLTIVGVAENVRFEGPVSAVRPAIYVAHAQRPRASYDGRTMTAVVRNRSATTDVAGAVRSVARSMHAGVTVSPARSMDSVVSAALARPQLMTWMMATFASVGLAIAAIGVYGVIAYVVARRTREIGVRVALGSTRAGVAWLIGRQTAVLLAAGFGLGCGAAIWMGRAMRALLFGIQPLDPATYLAVAAIMIVVVCAAVALPIRRAVSVDPLTALRVE